MPIVVPWSEKFQQHAAPPPRISAHAMVFGHLATRAACTVCSRHEPAGSSLPILVPILDSCDIYPLESGFGSGCRRTYP